jgi:hypothetical protein
VRASNCARSTTGPIYAMEHGFTKVGRAYERKFGAYTWRLYSIGGAWNLALERDGDAVKTVPAAGLAAGVRLSEFFQVALSEVSP